MSSYFRRVRAPRAPLREPRGSLRHPPLPGLLPPLPPCPALPCRQRMREAGMAGHGAASAAATALFAAAGAGAPRVPPAGERCVGPGPRPAARVRPALPSRPRPGSALPGRAAGASSLAASCGQGPPAPCSPPAPGSWRASAWWL